MLTKASLALLDALCAGRETTPNELATETVVSQDYIYDVLDRLLEDGLLTQTRGSKTGVSSG